MPLRFCLPASLSGRTLPLTCLAAVLAWSGTVPLAQAAPMPLRPAKAGKAAAGKGKPAQPAAKAAEAGKPPATEEVLGPPYALRDDVLAQADDLAERRNLDKAWVRQAVAQAVLLPTVQRLVLPAPRGAAKNWSLYRSRFIDAGRVRAGVQFWRTYRDALTRAEATYGVPAEVIVGILGVETIYGQNTGSFRVMDVLTTLAFDFPKAHPRAAERQAFFRNELEQFLSWCNRSNTDPMQPRGSYAGAMGLPQFMPSSIVNFAVDFDGDGKIDLQRSPVDAIGSVAHYFQAFNWQTGQPTHYAVSFAPETLDRDALLAPDILPTFTPATLAEKGVQLEGEARQHPGLLALVELQQGEQPPVYVAGTENFYAITRYNWSSYYAMAVIELGREVAAQLGNPSPAVPLRPMPAAAVRSPATPPVAAAPEAARPDTEPQPAQDLPPTEAAPQADLPAADPAAATPTGNP